MAGQVDKIHGVCTCIHICMMGSISNEVLCEFLPNKIKVCS